MIEIGGDSYWSVLNTRNSRSEDTSDCSYEDKYRKYSIPNRGSQDDSDSMTMSEACDDYFTCDVSFDPNLCAEDKIISKKTLASEFSTTKYRKIPKPVHSTTALIILEEAESEHRTSSCISKHVSYHTTCITSRVHTHHTTRSEIRPQTCNSHFRTHNGSSCSTHLTPTPSCNLCPVTLMQQALCLQPPQQDCYNVYQLDDVTRPHTVQFCICPEPDIQTEYQINQQICQKIQTTTYAVLDLSHDGNDLQTPPSICQSESSLQLVVRDSSKDSDAHSTIQIYLGEDIDSYSEDLEYSSSGELCDSCKCCCTTSDSDTAQHGDDRMDYWQLGRYTDTDGSTTQRNRAEKEEVLAVEYTVQDDSGELEQMQDRVKESTQEQQRPSSESSVMFKESSEEPELESAVVKSRKSSRLNTWTSTRAQNSRVSVVTRRRESRVSITTHTRKIFNTESTAWKESLKPPASSTPNKTSSSEEDSDFASSNEMVAEVLAHHAEFIHRRQSQTSLPSLARPEVETIPNRQRPHTAVSGRPRPRNIYSNSNVEWSQAVIDCFQTQVTMRVESAVGKRRGVEEDGDQSNPSSLKKPRTKYSSTSHRVVSVNLRKTKTKPNMNDKIKCKSTKFDNTTMFFEDDTQNSFLNCTQGVRQVDSEDTNVTHDSSDETSVSQKVMKKVSQVLAMLEVNATEDNVGNAKTNDGIGQKENATVNDKEIGEMSINTIDNLAIVTREKQKTLQNQLEQLYDGALRVKSLERLYNTYETDEMDRKQRIEDTIRKGKLDFLLKANNMGKLVTKSPITDPGPSCHEICDKVVEIVDNEKVKHEENGGTTALCQEVLPRRMIDTTLLGKAKKKINKLIKFRYFGLGRGRRSSTRSSTNLPEEDVDASIHVRAVIDDHDFYICVTCPQLEMDDKSYRTQIQVRPTLNRIKLKSSIEHNLKRKVKIKKIKLTQITMKKTPLMNSSKIIDLIEAFHLSDLLCRLCTVKKILRTAMSEHEEATMKVYLSKHISEDRILQPFMLISDKDHFKELHIDPKSYLHFTKRNQIHINIGPVIKCNSIYFDLTPIRVKPIDKDAILVRSISFIGKHSSVKNSFFSLTHDPIDLQSSWNTCSTLPSKEDGTLDSYTRNVFIWDNNQTVPSPIIAAETLGNVELIEIYRTQQKISDEELVAENRTDETGEKVTTCNTETRAIDNVVKEMDTTSSNWSDVIGNETSIEGDQQDVAKLSSNEINTNADENRSSLVVFDDFNKCLQFSFNKLALKFSSVGLSAADFIYSDTSTGQSEEIASTMLQVKRSSITTVVPDGTWMESSYSLCIQEIETMFESIQDINFGVDSVVTDDIVALGLQTSLIKEKKQEASSSSGETFNSNASETDSKSNVLTRGKTNIPSRHHYEDVTEAFRAMQVEENERERYKDQNTRKDNKKGVNNEVVGKGIDILMKTEDRRSVNVPSGTELSSNLPEEICSNTFDSEGQRILETYEHTLETLSERTESSFVMTGLQSMSVLSDIVRAYENTFTNLNLEHKFSFTETMQETRDHVTKEFVNIIRKNDFQFQLNPIELKVDNQICIRTRDHCYVPKPFLVFKKQRKDADLKRKGKENVLHKSNRTSRTPEMQRIKISNTPSGCKSKLTHTKSEISNTMSDINEKTIFDQVRENKNDGSFEETRTDQSKEHKPFFQVERARTPSTKRAEAVKCLMPSKVVSLSITETPVESTSTAWDIVFQDEGKIRTLFSNKKIFSEQNETEKTNYGHEIQSCHENNAIATVQRLKNVFAGETKYSGEELALKDSKYKVKHVELQSKVYNEQTTDTMPQDDEHDTPAIEVIMSPNNFKLRSPSVDQENSKKQKATRMKIVKTKRRKLRSRKGEERKPAEPLPQFDEPLAQFEEPLAQLKEPLAQFEEPLPHIKEPLAQLKEQLAQLKEPLAQFEEPLTELKESLAQLEEPLAQLKEPLSQLKEPLAQLKEPLAQLKEALAQIKEPLAQFEEPLPQIKEPLAQLKEPLAQFEEPLTELKEPLGQLKEPLAQLKEPLAQLKEPLSQLKEPLAQLKEPLAQLKEPLAQLKEPLAHLKEPLPLLAQPKLSRSRTESLTINSVNGSQETVSAPKTPTGKRVKECGNKAQRLRRTLSRKDKRTASKSPHSADSSKDPRTGRSPMLLSKCSKNSSYYSSSVSTSIKSSTHYFGTVAPTENVYRNAMDTNDRISENSEYPGCAPNEIAIKLHVDDHNFYIQCGSQLSCHNLNNFTITDEYDILLNDVTEPLLPHNLSDSSFNVAINHLDTTDVGQTPTIEKKVQEADMNNNCRRTEVIPDNEEPEQYSNITSSAENSNQTQAENTNMTSMPDSPSTVISSTHVKSVNSNQTQAENTNMTSMPDSPSTVISSTHVKSVTFRLPSPRKLIPVKTKRKLRIPIRKNSSLPQSVRNRTLSNDSRKPSKNPKERRKGKIPMRVALHDPAKNKSSVAVRVRSQKSLASQDLTRVSFKTRDYQLTQRRFDILSKMRQGKKASKVYGK